jgi:hypothetical protein
MLVIRPDQLTGRGIYMADQCTIGHGIRVAAYTGAVSLFPSPSSDFLLACPETCLNGRIVEPYIDAAGQCLRGCPLSTHAGLANHQCERPTCAGEWARSPNSTLPIMVLRTLDSLRGGTQLTYNYDSHRPAGAYTLGPEEAAAITARGATCRPCRCNGLDPCPKSRFFP